MDKETREFLDGKFNAIDEKLAGMDRNFLGMDEKYKETKHYFRIISEGLQSEIKLVAEGVANVNEKLDREVTFLRQEMKSEFGEVKAMIKFSHAELNHRVRTVEESVFSLQSRMERLEVRQ